MAQFHPFFFHAGLLKERYISPFTQAPWCLYLYPSSVLQTLQVMCYKKSTTDTDKNLRNNVSKQSRNLSVCFWQLSEAGRTLLSSA